MNNNENFLLKIIKWVINNILWDFITFLISLFISSSITLTQLDFLGISDHFTKIYVFLVYFFLFFGIVRLFVDFFQLLLQKDRTLLLAEARTEGVILRNKGQKINNEEEAKLWIDEYNRWNSETINKISRISKSKAEFFKVINRFKLHTGIMRIKAHTHSLQINVLEEKLLR